MLQTYKATLYGNFIEWNGEVPEIKDNKKVSVIVTILDDSEISEKEMRPYGLCANEFVVPDDFDAPLPEEVLTDFETV